MADLLGSGESMVVWWHVGHDGPFIRFGSFHHIYHTQTYIFTYSTFATVKYQHVHDLNRSWDNRSTMTITSENISWRNLVGFNVLVSSLFVHCNQRQTASTSYSYSVQILFTYCIILFICCKCKHLYDNRNEVR